MDPGTFEGVRTLLFVAGHRSATVTEAMAANADIWVLDLEDMVPAGSKDAARRSVRSTLASLSEDRAARTFIRPSLHEGRADPRDLELAAGLAGIVLPKAERDDQVVEASIEAAQAGAGPWVIPTIETAAGLLHAEAIARAERVLGLIFGPSDFSLDLGLASDGVRDVLDAARLGVVLCAAAARVPAIDGAYLGDDSATLKREASRASALGFRAKLIVDPAHAPVVNEALTPGETQVREATQVLATAEAGAVARIRAERLLARRTAIEAFARDLAMIVTADRR